MRILTLALKDIQQVLRDRSVLVMAFLMPIAFTYFMGLAFGGGSQESDPRLPVGWLDRDGGAALSLTLQQTFEASDAVRLVPVEAGDVEAQVREGDLAAAVVVPAGFSAAALSGQPLALDVVAQPMEARGQAAEGVVRAALVRVLSAAEAARLAAGEGADEATLSAAFVRATEAWQQPAVQVVSERLTAAQDDASQKIDNRYTQSSPGILVQFAIFGVMTPASILVTERKSRTLQRLLTTSMRRSEIILGHWLAMFLLALFQGVLLVVVGQLFFGVGYTREPLAVMLVLAGLAAVIASIGMLISTLAKGEEQVILFSLLAMFLLSALGGAWFPLEFTGKLFSVVGHLTPLAWAMDGLQNIVLRGLQFQSVLAPAAVLLGYTALIFALAVWKFRTE